MWKSSVKLARELGVSRQTVFRWIRDGKYERVEQTKGGHYCVWCKPEHSEFVGYCRVSSRKQISSLDIQASLIAERYPDFNRRGLQTLLEQALCGTQLHVVVTVIALDPGVRTFMTAFSPSEAIKFGDGYASKRVFPLLRKKDTLLGKRQRLLNTKCDAQWWRDQMRALNRSILRLSARIDDQVSDIHRRVAYDLVSNYSTIICPPFETSQMVAKEGRKLRRSSVRQMQSLGHFAFQQHLKWMCRKYGNTFVACTEAYTSKTRSWDGVIHKTLGGATTISDGEIVVDRDHNGARGIFLLANTRQLTPHSDPNVTVGTD